MTPAEVFLHALGKERATYQTFPDKDGGKPYPQIFHGPYRVLERKLRELNQRGAGIFVAVNHTDLRGRRAENVTSVAAYFVDLDGTPLPDSWPLPPTLVIESSPGRFHAYWRVTGAPLESFEHTQKHVALLLGGDEKVCDLPRVMRLPGFKHQKAEPFDTRILTVDEDAVYPHAVFTEHFAVPAVRKRTPLPAACAAYLRRRQPNNRQQGQQFQRDLGTAAQRVATAAEGNRNHTLYRVAAALANDVRSGSVARDEAERELLAAAQQAGLGEFEATRTINSAMRYAR